MNDFVTHYLGLEHPINGSKFLLCCPKCSWKTAVHMFASCSLHPMAPTPYSYVAVQSRASSHLPTTNLLLPTSLTLLSFFPSSIFDKVTSVMDPTSVVALIGTCLTIAARVTTISKHLWTLKTTFRETEWRITLFQAQLSGISTAMKSISEWLETSIALDEEMRTQLQKSLEACDTLVLMILDHLGRNETQSNKISLWGKAKYHFNGDIIASYEDLLGRQVQALSLLLQILALEVCLDL